MKTVNYKYLSEFKDCMALTIEEIREEITNYNWLLDKGTLSSKEKADCWLRLGFLYYVLGQKNALLWEPNKAMNCFKKVLEIDPNSYNAWFYRGYALYKMHRYKDAITNFDKALETDSEDSYNAWYFRGRALFDFKEYKEAIASYDKAIEINPDDYLALEGKRVSLIRLEESKPGAILMNRLEMAIMKITRFLFRFPYE